jgi:hypothetical protein
MGSLVSPVANYSLLVAACYEDEERFFAHAKFF